MLKTYLDLGEKEDATDDVMCVAAITFKPTPYKQFVRSWNPMLDAWGASAFHATDFYNGAEEFVRKTPERKCLYDEDSKRIPTMIGKYIQRAVLISFRPQEFLDVAPQEWKNKFGVNVHSHAVQLCLFSNGWWRFGKCRHESFAYFMESGDTDEGQVVKDVERMRNDPETSKVIKVSSFTSAQKGIARGLEAADFAAWHWNKYYMDKVRTGRQMEPRKDFAAFANITQGKLQYIFATGDKLKYFFSLGKVSPSWDQP